MDLRARRCRGLLDIRVGRRRPSSRPQPPIPPVEITSTCRRSHPSSRYPDRPTEGNAQPRSALLDIMKPKRASSRMRKRASRHSLRVQLVEQRVVNLESEGGALITDSGHRSQPRRRGTVGTPHLDNPPQPRDDDNGLTPAYPAVVVPSATKQARSRTAVARTDRRYARRSPPSPLPPYQSTLSKNGALTSSRPVRGLRRCSGHARVRQASMDRPLSGAPRRRSRVCERSPARRFPRTSLGS